MMFFKRDTITLAAACYSVCDKATLWDSSPRCTAAKLNGDFWELTLHTVSMKLDCLVDAFTGEVKELRAWREADMERNSRHFPLEVHSAA